MSSSFESLIVMAGPREKPRVEGDQKWEKWAVSGANAVVNAEEECLKNCHDQERRGDDSSRIRPRWWRAGGRGGGDGAVAMESPKKYNKKKRSQPSTP